MAAGHREQDWLGAIRATVLAGDWPAAEAECGRALLAYPESLELARLQAGIYQQTARPEAAAARYRELLARHPDDAASAFALARLLGRQGRNAAAADVVRAHLTAGPGLSPELAITALELLDDLGRTHAAAAIATAAVAQHPADARLHAYAGMLLLQQGDFEAARSHYEYALAADPRAWEWHVPLGLANAQRYADAKHPDLARFRDGLQRPGLSAAAAAELEFALGKAYDDLGDFAAAARHLRQGNRAMHALVPWSRDAWHRDLQMRRSRPPPPARSSADAGSVPVFIVGMPRSGTTLLATRLAQDPRICNRGELGWIEHLVGRIEGAGRIDQALLERSAADYMAQLQQDDGGAARWFIDKQPLNFRYVDWILALWPHARILHCRRHARATALSLWMQCFLSATHAYAYDFADIAQVLHDEGTLMAHWQARYPGAIHAVQYEELVADADAVVGAAAGWLGLTAGSRNAAAAQPIATSSLWQARQPVYTRSLERWRHYATDVPELLELDA